MIAQIRTLASSFELGNLLVPGVDRETAVLSTTQALVNRKVYLLSPEVMGMPKSQAWNLAPWGTKPVKETYVLPTGRRRVLFSGASGEGKWETGQRQGA